MLAAGVGGQGERLAGRRRKMAVESRVTQEEIKKEPEKPIDREKTCPLLLRVFTTNNGRHHRMDEFSRGNVPSSELQIYTWMDATLKELTSLVKEVYPEARKKGTHFNFAIVFMDLKRPGYRVKEIGSTMSGRKGTDDSMTLQSQKFQIGDYLDIAITPPNRAPPPSGRSCYAAFDVLKLMIFVAQPPKCYDYSIYYHAWLKKLKLGMRVTTLMGR
ncbi:histone deacetylase complex subunit SAP18 isoform X2 [Castor canadensis]